MTLFGMYFTLYKIQKNTRSTPLVHISICTLTRNCRVVTDEKNLQAVGILLPLVDAVSTADTGNCTLFLFLFVEVALIVEVTEEDDEGDRVTTHHRIH